MQAYRRAQGRALLIPVPRLGSHKPPSMLYKQAWRLRRRLLRCAKLTPPSVHTDLLCPADTVMDLNIGAALWLAAQAEGELYGEGGFYRSRARVVLLGHGADELCGGYGRHRTAFRHQV